MYILLVNIKIYHKPTFREVYTNFDRILPSAYVFCTGDTFCYKFFQIGSSWTRLHTRLLFKKNFVKNGYP